MAAHARDVNILIWTAVSRSVIKQMIASWSVAREPWAGGCCLPATRRRGPSQRNRAVSSTPQSSADDSLGSTSEPDVSPNKASWTGSAILLRYGLPSPLDQQHPRTTLRDPETKKAK